MSAANFGAVSASLTFARLARSPQGGGPPPEEPSVKSLLWGIAVLAVLAFSPVIIVGGLFLFFPPDTYVRSEYHPAVVTSVEPYYCQVSFSVDGQSYRRVNMGKHCHLRVKRGHRWIATVDVLRTSKGRTYGAINWAALRREFVS